MNKIWQGLKGSRKFQAWLALTVLITVMAFLKLATFSEWLEGIQWIFGIYCGGNGIEHGAAAYTNKTKPVEDESR